MMETMTNIIGWVASGFIFASYACKNMTHLRILNTLASVCFMVYGVLFAAPSVIVLNASLIVVNALHLLSHGKFAEMFKTYPVKSVSVFVVYAIAVTIFSFVCSGGSYVEIMGTLSSVGFVGGFLMTNEKKMRSICSVSTIINILYALMIGSYSVVATNICSLTMNMYRLYQAYANDKKNNKLNKTNNKQNKVAAY